MSEALLAAPSPADLDPSLEPAPEPLDPHLTGPEPTSLDTDPASAPEATKSKLEQAKENAKLLGLVALDGAGELGRGIGKITEFSARMTGRGARAAGRGAKATGVAAGHGAKRAGSGVAKKARESSKETVKRLEKDDKFYESLGERALVGLGKKPASTREEQIPRTRSQRRRAARVETRLKEHERQIKLDKWREDFFRGTNHHTEIRKGATKQARKEATRIHEKAYKNGTLAPEEYVKGLEKASKITVTGDDKMMRKSKARINDSVNSIKAEADPWKLRKIRNGRIRLNQGIAGQEPRTARTSPTLVEATLPPVSTILPELSTQAPRAVEVTPTKVLSREEEDRAILVKLRSEGKLPTPTPKTAEKSVKEPDVAPVAETKPAQTGLGELAELFSFVEAGVDDPLLYAEIMSRKANIHADYYMSGGRPAYQGADDYVDQTRHDYYEYVYTNAEGKTVTERMSDELAKKILAFEPPVEAPAPETAKATPAKKAQRKSEAPAKKRSERIVAPEDLAKELGIEEE